MPGWKGIAAPWRWRLWCNNDDIYLQKSSDSPSFSLSRISLNSRKFVQKHLCEDGISVLSKFLTFPQSFKTTNWRGKFTEVYESTHTFISSYVVIHHVQTWPRAHVIHTTGKKLKTKKEKTKTQNSVHFVFCNSPFTNH